MLFLCQIGVCGARVEASEAGAASCGAPFFALPLLLRSAARVAPENGCVQGVHPASPGPKPPPAGPGPPPDIRFQGLGTQCGAVQCRVIAAIPFLDAIFLFFPIFRFPFDSGRIQKPSNHCLCDSDGFQCGGKSRRSLCCHVISVGTRDALSFPPSFPFSG